MKQHGPCVYHDTSSKGGNKRHNTYRADVTLRGIRYRRRNKNRKELKKWLNAMKGGRR